MFGVFKRCLAIVGAPIPQTAPERLFKYSDAIFLEVEPEFGARPSQRVDAMLTRVILVEHALHLLLLILAE